jgi:hypothetical protein
MCIKGFFVVDESEAEVKKNAKWWCGHWAGLMPQEGAWTILFRAKTADYGRALVS